MGVLRSELSEGQWRQLEPLLPDRSGHVGRPAEDNRRFGNGVLWVIRSEMRWAPAGGEIASSPTLCGTSRIRI
jgi:transposase